MVAIAEPWRERMTSADPPPHLEAVPGPESGATIHFDDLYRQEWPGITAFGWSLTGSWVIAEELAQDAFHDAYRRWTQVGALDRPGAWVRRAVANRAISYRRHVGVERNGLARLVSRARVEAARTDEDRTAREASVADAVFWAAVRSLPDRQAQCVALHYLEDRPVAEIAEILDIKAATVKVHLHRGRLALARRLTDPGEPIVIDLETKEHR